MVFIVQSFTSLVKLVAIVNEIAFLTSLAGSLLLVYGNTTDFVRWFCILKLYWVYLLVLIGFSLRSCHLQKAVILLLSFQFGCLLFFFLSIFLMRLGLSSTMLNKVVRVGILVLFLILEGRLFTFQYDISCGFVIYALYYVEVHSLYT